MSTLTISTDKTAYAPGDQIVVTLSTDVPMTESVTLHASAERPNGTTEIQDTVSTIVGRYSVTADGYDAAQDPDNPARFVLTRSAAA